MLVTMSNKELHRLSVIQAVIEKRLRRRDAASQLDLTERQVQRLMNRYRESGAAGLTDARRGKPGTHRIDETLRHRILSLLRENYVGFGPTLAAEKLQERHGITISVETLRCWMTADGLWIPHARRQPRIYQPRQRRDCLGELIQIDGSHHDWFEGRAPKCCLLVYVDDATGRLMHLRFCQSESAFVCVAVMRYLTDRQVQRLMNRYRESGAAGLINARRGKPGTHRIDEALRHRILTLLREKFGRAINELNITGICANTSSARGRVERAHLTLQDRLVKELRLRKITTPETANAFAAESIVDYNRRFAKEPRHDFNVHRALDADDNLDLILTWREPGRVSKSLTVQYDKTLYSLEDNDKSRQVMGQYIEIYHYPGGKIELRANGTALPCSAYDRLVEIAEVLKEAVLDEWINMHTILPLEL